MPKVPFFDKDAVFEKHAGHPIKRPKATIALGPLKK